MKFGTKQHDLNSSPGQSLDGSFRNIDPGLWQKDFDFSPEQSLDGSFRKSSYVTSAPSISGNSTSSKIPSSRRVSKGLKDYRRKIVNIKLFTQILQDWVWEKSYGDSTIRKKPFASPFIIDEFRNFDLALEGVLFQQLFRMPFSPNTDDDVKQDEYLAVEDFIHTMANGLWRTFWRKSAPMPFYVSCARHPTSKFYTVEKAILRGRLEELCGLALVPKSGAETRVHWDQVAEFTLFRPNILEENELKLSTKVICEALFYGLHILISRSLSQVSTTNSDSVFLLVLDSKFGGVVKLSGDLSKLEQNPENTYLSAIEWIKNHAEVSVSAVDQVWNKLGNVNWGDLGTLQLLLATFQTMVQWNGPPRKSIASLIANHSLRIQKRRIDCGVAENESALVPYQHASQDYGEIVELDQTDHINGKHASRLRPMQGDVLLLEDSRHGEKGFQIQDCLVGGNYYLYTAISIEHPTELLSLYVGSHPSRLEPSWEDMSLWYQIQRQTKVLNVFKQHGMSCRYLPEIIASGRLLHSGPCNKQTPAGRCDHPWCGTPILVTCPVGEPVSFIIARDGRFSSKEASRCCRDCLAALRSAAKANVQHGDICPENIINVVEPQGTRNKSLYLPISWGRAVLEDRDSPAINLQFSSSHALQHGKLCPSSDAESLTYLLFFICGGNMPQQDSIESALEWREKSWAKRVIQQHLGEVSPLLKAFADYVDSLCGTPYPIDYEIWLERLNKAVDGSAEKGKTIEEAALVLRLEDVAESSGTSGGGTPLSVL